MEIRNADMNDVIIDGRKFNGRKVTIINGKVIVDGVTQDGELVGEVNITVHGDVTHIDNDCGKVTCNSAVDIQTMAGDVECGDVTGSVSTMSGDVNCQAVGGSVSTMSGNIRHKG